MIAWLKSKTHRHQYATDNIPQDGRWYWVTCTVEGCAHRWFITKPLEEQA